VSGIVGGTSNSGLGSAPLTVVNNVGLPVEVQYIPASRDMRIAMNTSGYNILAQPRANYCSLIHQGNWLGTVLDWDPMTLLPSLMNAGGEELWVYLQKNGAANNLLDDRGLPLTDGRWRLVYGDATAGVGPAVHNITINLAVGGGWVEDTAAGSAGTWSATDNCWHDIIKEYVYTYPGSGQGGSILFKMSSVTGEVKFPDKGNGQVELFVSSPSVADHDVASPVDYDPLAMDQEYFRVHRDFLPGADELYSLGWVRNSYGAILRTSTSARRMISEIQVPGVAQPCQHNTMTAPSFLI
jgi:hypothetical protein